MTGDKDQAKANEKTAQQATGASGELGANELENAAGGLPAVQKTREAAGRLDG
jgi:hypothetical protein